jgi:hypothetical protein
MVGIKDMLRRITVLQGLRVPDTIAMQPNACPGHLTCKPAFPSTPMSRFLFALSLFLFAATAMAGTPVVGDETADNSAKQGKATTTSSTPDGDATVGGHPVTTPARTSTSHAVTPRWHSLLPGMIR